MQDLKLLLKDFKEMNKFKQPEMAEYLGIKERTYQEIEKTGDPIKVETLLRILDRIGVPPTQFFADNVAEGEQGIVKVNQDIRKHSEDARPATTDIPMMDDMMEATNDSAYEDESWISRHLRKMTVPTTFLRGKSQSFIATEYYGFNMAPTIYDGDVIVMYLVPKEQWRNLKDKRLYFVGYQGEHDIESVWAGRMLNQLDRKDAITLVSDHLDPKQFPNKRIPVTKIISVWDVYFKISWNLPNANGDIATEVNKLQARVDRLEGGSHNTLE